MSLTTRARFRAAIVVVAPAVLLGGFAYHPYVAKGTDEAALATAAASDTTRWGLSHLAIGIGYALTALAFIAIRSYLRDAGEERWSVVGLPLVVAGSALFPILTGMEFALLAAAETGGDVEATQTELMPWFLPILVTGAVSFALGALGFAVGVVRNGLLSAQRSWLVAVALVVMAAARFIPLGAAQFVIGVAAVLALWPLAAEMWTHPRPRAAEQPGPMPAS
jgi:hypothetical protein